MSLNKLSSYILFQDHHLIIANKPGGVPAQEDKTKDPSLLRLLQAYCKRDLFLVHRIDRPVSGLIVLVKNSKDQIIIQNQIQSQQFEKTYLAIVPKIDIPEQGVLEHFIIHDTKHNKGRISNSGDDEQAKKATLSYVIKKDLDQYRLLEIKTQTGRFHQIRAQLAHENMPIKGDVKYGARRSNKDRTIGLHAWKISFYHPCSNRAVNFIADLPENDIWPHFQLTEE